MRAFVTGGHGFVGPWLCRHLEECGDEVVAPGLDVDVTDAAAIRQAMTDARPDAVYHLAAQSSVSSSWTDPAATFAVNALGTVQVLAAARDCTPRPRVLLVSSVEVYGAVKPFELPVTEDAPFRPATPYAASKAAAELAGLQAYLGWNLEVVRARPFSHTGPGQTDRFFVPDMARQIVAAAEAGVSELRTGNLAVRRDFADVRDVVRAYRLLVESGHSGEVYNVCRGRSVTLDEVVRRLLSLAGIDLEVTVEPSRLRPVDVPDLCGDPTRLH
ncbi:MAG: GDP-mannose 4,6-dehydratase, partial [Actinomycetota bacterium]|nr:GDP-mannose 4,6-dehydratase [Actinomycetota bacterium]